MFQVPASLDSLIEAILQFRDQHHLPVTVMVDFQKKEENVKSAIGFRVIPEGHEGQTFMIPFPLICSSRSLAFMLGSLNVNQFALLLQDNLNRRHN